MDWAKTISSSVAASLAAAFEVVPVWTLVVVLLVVGCGPELRRIALTASEIAWRWRRRENRLEVSRPSAGPRRPDVDG